VDLPSLIFWPLMWSLSPSHDRGLSTFTLTSCSLCQKGSPRVSRETSRKQKNALSRLTMRILNCSVTSLNTCIATDRFSPAKSSIAPNTSPWHVCMLWGRELWCQLSKHTAFGRLLSRWKYVPRFRTRACMSFYSLLARRSQRGFGKTRSGHRSSGIAEIRSQPCRSLPCFASCCMSSQNWADSCASGCTGTNLGKLRHQISFCAKSLALKASILLPKSLPSHLMRTKPDRARF
jgi:hypothetical protein